MEVTRVSLWHRLLIRCGSAMQVIWEGLRGSATCLFAVLRADSMWVIWGDICVAVTCVCSSAFWLNVDEVGVVRGSRERVCVAVTHMSLWHCLQGCDVLIFSVRVTRKCLRGSDMCVFRCEGFGRALRAYAIWSAWQ